MKILKSDADESKQQVTVTIGQVGNDVVSVQDGGLGEFMVLYETPDGLPSARIILGLRQLADEMERGRHGIGATQREARA